MLNQLSQMSQEKRMLRPPLVLLEYGKERAGRNRVLCHLSFVCGSLSDLNMSSSPKLVCSVQNPKGLLISAHGGCSVASLKILELKK